MKKSLYFKIAVLLIIQAVIFSDIAWAMVDCVLVKKPQNTDLLSPALQINTSQLQQLFQQKLLVKDKIKRVERVMTLAGPIPQEDGQFYSEVEINFRHDRPGFLAAVLEIVSRYQANMISMEYFKRDDVLIFKFMVLTINREDMKKIITELKSLADIKKSRLKQIFKVPRNKWILEFYILDRPGSLLEIAKFLRAKNINISSFLTPGVGVGRAHFIFEVEVPINEEMRGVLKELKNNIKIGDELIVIESKQGQLVDKILDDLLAVIGKKIHKEDEKKEIRKAMRKALLVVANRHLSQARKDRKTPSIRHQIEVVKILVDEMRVFRPEIVQYVAKKFNISESAAKIIILNSALLHDAIEEEDITQQRLRKNFKYNIYEIVLLLSKNIMHRGKDGEEVYLTNLLKERGILNLIAQLIKIADRLHNIRTLHGLKEIKRKETFFSTLDTFYLAFINKIDLNLIDKNIADAFREGIRLLDNEMIKAGKEFGYLDLKGEIVDSKLRTYLICYIPQSQREKQEEIKANFKAIRDGYQNTINRLSSQKSYPLMLRDEFINQQLLLFPVQAIEHSI